MPSARNLFASVAMPYASEAGRQYNAVDFGAAGDGVTDDTSALQNAINLAAARGGGTILLPFAAFATSQPLILPPQIALVGEHHSHLDTSSAAIRPLANFAGAAVILLLDQATGGYGVESTEQRIQRLLIDCSNLGGTTIDGIQAQGLVHGVLLADVQIYKAPAHGLFAVSNGSGSPSSWRLVRLVANACGSYGFSFSTPDNTWLDCEALGNAKSGFFLSSVPNNHFIGCRAEWNGFDGFTLSGAWGSGNGSGGCEFIGCSTDRNTQNGWNIIATGTVPVIMTGCMSRRDGRNGGAGGGSFAGISCAGSSLPVTINGATVFPGVDDNGSGTNSPEYGFSITGGARSVILGGGYLQGATAGVHDDGTNTWARNANVLEASGTTEAPALLANPLGHGVVQPAVPASGTAFANTSGRTCTVYVSGGTVTAIAIGGAVTGLTAGSFRVANNQTITLTYGAAPTWQWFGD